MRANSTFWALPIVVLMVVCSGCKGSDKSDTTNGVDPSGETLQVNPLAESYPQGLSMSALSDDNSGESGYYQGSLAIDDSSSLLGHYEDTLNLLETPLDLLGYDRQACEDYHDGLPDDKKVACSCSHAQSNSQNSGDKGNPKDSLDAPSEKQILDALFRTGRDELVDSEKRLRGDDSVDCFSDRLKKVVRTVLEASKGEGLYSVNCYEFDWGLEFPYRVDENEQETSNKEVCLVAFTRKEMAEAQAYLEFSKQMTQAMLCQAKKSGKSVELNVGDEIDLTDILDGLNQDTVEPTYAKIARVKDNKGAKVYQTRFTMKVSPPEGSDLEFDFTILHSPQGDGNKVYTGLLSLTHSLPSGSGSTAGKQKALSVAYSSKYDNDKEVRRVKIELRMGEFKEGRDPFDDGEVNFNVGANSDGTFSLMQGEENTNLSNMKYVLYDGYPTEGVMNFAYWRNPGEKYDENARGFIFNIERTKDNLIKGCGYAGASAPTDVSSADGLSIRKALKTDASLEPKGFLRPFLCPFDPAAADPSMVNWGDNANKPNRERRYGAKIWKQCFTQNSNGTYSIDREKTKGKDFSFASPSSVGDFVAPPPPPPPPPPPK